MVRHCWARSRSASSRWPVSCWREWSSSAIAMAASTATRTESTVCVASADRDHFFIDIARQFLDIGFVQISAQGVTLPVNFHFHAIRHSVRSPLDAPILFRPAAHGKRVSIQVTDFYCLKYLYPRWLGSRANGAEDASPGQRPGAWPRNTVRPERAEGFSLNQSQ